MLSTTSLGLGILAKLAPLIVLPTFVRRLRATGLWPLPAVVVAGYLPFASAGRALFRGLSEYGHRWEHNDFLFRGLLETMLWVDPSGILSAGITRLRSALGADALEVLYPYTHPQYVARILAAGIMAFVAAYVTFKPWAPSRELLVALAVVLLMSPTVHPWYLIWMVPLLALHPSRGLLLWTGLVGLSYAFPEVGGDAPYAGPLLFAEYVPVLALLAFDVARFRVPPPPIGSPVSVVRGGPTRRDPPPASRL